MVVGCHARCWPARQEQFGVQCLAQGHLDMQTGALLDVCKNQQLRRKYMIYDFVVNCLINLFKIKIFSCQIKWSYADIIKADISF